MNRNDFDLDKLIDQAVDEIRDDAMNPDAEASVSDRVWSAVREEAEQSASEAPEHQQIHNCEDFQALVPAYLQGALSDARKMLFEDHVNECIPCRRALKQARQARRPATAARRAPQESMVLRWGFRAAAAAIVAFAVVGLSFNVGDLLKIRTGGLIRVQNISGELLRVTPNGAVPVSNGDQVRLNKGEALRTTKGGHAMIQLEDGSVIEMRERTELNVSNEAWFWNRSDTDGVIDLERGSLIVEASPQGSGHLFVETTDSLTAVTGTVFAVNHGIKGTRVSVIEGEVHVDHSVNTILHPGDQVTTQPELLRIPVAEEIAWSQNYDKHIQMLAELTDLGRELDRAMRPELRYSTELLDIAPADTVVFVGIPNVSDSIGEAYEILMQKVEQSQALQEWWAEHITDAGMDDNIREAVERVEAYGSQLGDEIALALHLDEQGDVNDPLVYARLEDRAAMRALVEEDIERLAREGEGLLVIVEGDRPEAGGQDADMILWLTDDLMVVSPGSDEIYRMANQLREASTGFGATNGLYDRLADIYRNGTEFAIGVDLEKILAVATEEERREAETAPVQALTRTAGAPHSIDDTNGLEELGLLDMQHLVGDRKSIDGRTENRVVLSFTEERRGLAGWLDEPAPMGSLDFITTNATLAAGFVMEEPSILVDELFEILTSFDPSFEEHLAEFEAEFDVDIRDDFVAPLGGEMTFAIDGPIDFSGGLPEPSWKLIVEVYDPNQLQQTLGWLVDQINQFAQDEGHEGFALITETAGGREWQRLESIDTGFGVDFLYIDGYMIAGSSRTLIEQAIETRDMDMGLTTDADFRDMLPRDGEVNFSGLIYQNLGSLLGPLASLGQAAQKLSPESAQMARELSRNSKPSMTVAYGATDHITFVYTHEGGFFSSALTSFFSLRSFMGVRELIGDLPNG